MAHLQEQLEELELLESMFSYPGEFQIEDSASYDLAAAFVKNLAPDPPKCISCRVNIPIDARHDTDDEVDDDNDAEDEGGDKSKEEAAEKGKEEVTSHTVNISLRLPTRSGQSHVELMLKYLGVITIC